MAEMTLAANVGQGTATFSVTGSWTYGDSTNFADYTTYKFVATPANGWRFVGWEIRHRSQSYASNYDGQWSDWTSWISFSSSSTETWEVVTEYHYSGAYGSGVGRYEYEVRAVFAEEGFTVAVDVSSESPANSGSVSGGGTYASGATCTISATAASGYRFTKWVCSDGREITDVSYTFTVGSSLTFTAQFEEGTAKRQGGANGDTDNPTRR